jgi:hypothetical protein
MPSPSAVPGLESTHHTPVGKRAIALLLAGFCGEKNGGTIAVRNFIMPNGQNQISPPAVRISRQSLACGPVRSRVI